MKKIIKLAPTIIGVLIALALLILLMKPIQDFFIRAEDITPVDVIISDITENSVKISWATAQDVQGVIEYGASPTALNYYAPESTKTKSHSVDLTLLAPATTYYFQIRIGDKKFDNSGVPWTFSSKGGEENRRAVLSPPKMNLTPISSVEIQSTTTIDVKCDETDCQKIKGKLGKGCTTVDYLKCLKSPTITP